MTNILPFILFIAQIIILYFISRVTIQQIFMILRRFFHSDRVTFILISLLFLPGTILHELSHFMMAMILFLRVREVHIFPQWEKDYIKLGRVIYEKKDPIRGMLVGIAPIFVGLIFFWMLSSFNLFPSPNIWLTLLVGYGIFIVSTTMFSSKQDLVDSAVLIPIIIIAAIAIYLFQIDLYSVLQNEVLMTKVNTFLYTINYYAFFSIIIHIGTIVILKSILYLSRSRYR